MRDLVTTQWLARHLHAPDLRVVDVRWYLDPARKGREAHAAGFTGMYTYDVVAYSPADYATICGTARANLLLCAPSVGPGFSALRATGGRVFGPSGAAERLGIPRSTLESKIRSLKINKGRFRARAPKRS